jgi:hypothetical protein
MKLIDKTPLQDENGEIKLLQRIQGTFRYGFEWYPELEAQKSVLAHLTRVLGKGFTVVRNQTLGASEITIPLAIVGPPGIYVAHITHLRGTYQARGDSWGQIYGINYRPSRVNLLTRTQYLARALQAFIEQQGVKLPKPVEPVILAADPAFHLEPLNPIVRIVLLDALERWGASLEAAAPVFTLETAYELADRIVNPRPMKKAKPAEAAEKPPEKSPAEAINTHRTAEEAGPFDPAELEFAFDENEGLVVPPELVETNPAIPIPPKEAAKRRFLGMSVPQLALLGGMLLFEACLLIILALSIYFNL